MGIKNLHGLLRKVCPEVYRKVHLRDLAYKRVAADISLYLYKYKAIYGSGWLDAFVRMVCSLRASEIHCVFVFDGKPPDDKKAEQERRREQRRRTERRATDLHLDLQEYKRNGLVSDGMRKVLTAREPSKRKRLLSSVAHAPEIDVSFLEHEVLRLEKQVVRLTGEDIEVSRALFGLLGVPYLDAPGEAETLCAALCRGGKVEAVLSEDTDVLACGAPTFVHGLDVRTSSAMVVEHRDVLEALGVSEASFVDLCIMSGPDYNSNIKGIGSKKAYDLISEFGRIEYLPEKHDVECLRHIRCRELFTLRPPLPDSVSFCGCPPSWSSLQNFLDRHGSRIRVSSVQKAFGPKEIVFE